VKGSEAQMMIEFIERSPNVYPHCEMYRFRGPNSNTYVQWVIDNFPNSGLQLPFNAFGKGYKVN